MKRQTRITQMVKDFVTTRIRMVTSLFSQSIRVLARNTSGSSHWSQRGTALLEVMVALVLLGTTGTAFLQVMDTGLRSQNFVTEGVTARNLVASQLEVLNNTPYQDSYPVTVETPSGYSLSLDVTEADTDLQKIKVTVFHGDNILLSLEAFKVKQ